jgi:hypothetical protein
MELSGLNLRIKAAHTLYRKVWGKKSDDIFEAVPGRGDYRYLTTQKIVELGLEALSYKAKILLVREEFEIAYKELKDYNKPPNESGGVVVTGQPGIGTHCLSPTANSFTNNHHSHDLGKTCFFYYLLLQLLCEKKTVAFQVNNHFVLFQEAGVHFARNASGSDDAGTAIPHGTWALTDSHTDYAQPCKAFVTASERNCAWLVQTTSPLSNNWSHWHKSQNAYMYWMDVFSFDELSVLGYVQHGPNYLYLHAELFVVQYSISTSNVCTTIIIYGALTRAPASPWQILNDSRIIKWLWLSPHVSSPKKSFNSVISIR